MQYVMFVYMSFQLLTLLQSNGNCILIPLNINHTFFTMSLNLILNIILLSYLYEINNIYLNQLTTLLTLQIILLLTRLYQIWHAAHIALGQQFILTHLEQLLLLNQFIAVGALAWVYNLESVDWFACFVDQVGVSFAD